MKMFFIDGRKAKYYFIITFIVLGLGVGFAKFVMKDDAKDLSIFSVSSSPETVDLTPSTGIPDLDTVKTDPISSIPKLVATDGKKHAIYKVATERKVAALTFDISWGTKVPGPVMDILKEHNVKSTFFLSGPWALQYPEYPRRLVKEGHEIASHGNRHIDLDKESADTVREEIIKAHHSISEVTGVEARLIRTPNGAYNDMVLDVADQLGYKVIQWSNDSLDWKNPGVDAIVNRVLDKIHPGAIILMHASDTCLQTPEALPKVLEGLKAKGYELVTVTELLDEGPGVIH